jgi:hypothetical protein
MQDDCAAAPFVPTLLPRLVGLIARVAINPTGCGRLFATQDAKIGRQSFVVILPPQFAHAWFVILATRRSARRLLIETFLAASLAFDDLFLGIAAEGTDLRSFALLVAPGGLLRCFFRVLRAASRARNGLLVARTTETGFGPPPGPITIGSLLFFRCLRHIVSKQKKSGGRSALHSLYDTFRRKISSVNDHAKSARAKPPVWPIVPPIVS